MTNEEATVWGNTQGEPPRKPEPIDDDQTVIKSIIEGQYDASLSHIQKAISDRTKAIAYSTIHTLMPGMRVKFVRGRPRYLIGELATIHKVMQTWIEIKLDKDCGKFRAGIPIRCPGTLIEKV